MSLCVNCGNPLNEQDAFCSKCGSSVSKQAIENIIENSQFTDDVDNFCKRDNKKFNVSNKGIKFLIVSLVGLALSILVTSVGGVLGAVGARVAVLFFAMLYVSGILCIIYSHKLPKCKGRRLGITFTAINSIVLLIVAISFIVSYNSQSSTSVESPYTPIEDSIQNSEEDGAAPVEGTEILNQGTNWEEYEPLYIGTIPVGCLMVSDATPSAVSSCIKNALQTDKNFYAAECESKNIKSKMVIEELLDISGCVGTAIFNFDWNDSLSSIVFKFDDDGNFTPELFNDLHKEICTVLNVSSCWGEQYGLHKEAQNGGYYSCSWDSKMFDCDLHCWWDNNGLPDDGQIKFERTITTEKSNYDIPTTSSSITSNNLYISGQYHAGANPYVDGVITNNSDSLVKYIKIKIALYDNNKVVDTVWTYAVGAEGITPGESSQWKVYCSDAEAIKISIIE